MQYTYFNNVRVPSYVIGRKKYGDVKRLALLVDQSIDIFRSLVDFREDITITLKPMRGYANGIYDPNVDEVELDFRSGDDFHLISVLAHELVHAEQYKQGRLNSEWHHFGYTYRWYDTYMYLTEQRYKTYIPPWEQEAYERQDGLALVVCAELGI